MCVELLRGTNSLVLFRTRLREDTEAGTEHGRDGKDTVSAQLLFYLETTEPFLNHLFPLSLPSPCFTGTGIH